MTPRISVRSFIRHMMPHGSNPPDPEAPKRASWKRFPVWPPDLFAVAAALVDNNGCYTRLGIGPGDPSQRLEIEDEQVRGLLIKAAQDWRTGAWFAEPGRRPARAPASRMRRIQALWKDLEACEEDVGRRRFGGWTDAALQLLVVADEACEGLGLDAAESDITWINFVYRAWSNVESGSQARVGSSGLVVRAPTLLTACQAVSPDVVCVQPKTMTPSVGCSIRSLSRNLALLPPAGQVKTRFNQYLAADLERSAPMFNVLVVPFPYRLTGSSFIPKRAATSKLDDYSGCFGVRQTWALKPGEIGDFVKALLDQSEAEVDFVDAIVFPELALDETSYREAAEAIRDRPHGARQVRFFVAGVALEQGGELRNAAGTAVFLADSPPDPATDVDTDAATSSAASAAPWSFQLSGFQSKHHRWRVDETQIVQYSLGAALATKRSWWEDIVVEDRNVHFYVFRRGACFTSLVCEDLARIDPCQSVVRAVGPNIVFALLMDGPQLKDRWSARYAMGLADDPGCSVLSLTSFALVERSNRHFGGRRRVIALWRQAQDGTRELEVPENAHALVLSLNECERRELTIDGRDRRDRPAWRLSGVHPVRAPSSPSWSS